MPRPQPSDLRPMLYDRVGNILQDLIAGPAFERTRSAQVALLRAAADIRAVLDEATPQGLAAWSGARRA